MFVELADKVDRPETSDAEPEYGSMNHDVAMQVFITTFYYYY